MAKEDLFFKLNIKDYSNLLENVLENKSFSEDAKNILLNILYKIEIAYEDYKKVKVYVDLKKDLLEKIIENIKENCDKIEIVKPKLNGETKLGNQKYIVQKEDGKIISYPNEKNVFYALNHLNDNSIIINTKYKSLKEPVKQLINQGFVINMQEIIRDFDGWVWNIVSSEIENYSYNLVYQNIRILYGNKFLQKFINNEIIESGIENLIYKIAILEYIKDNYERKENILKIKKELEDELDKMNNKKQYLHEIANSKKIIGKQIKEIDEKINSNKLLRESFIEENKNLEESKQIFSLSEYSEVLQKRRIELLKELDFYSDLMKPMNYVKKKEELSKEYVILNGINYDKDLKKETYKILLDLQKEFLKLFNEKIKEVESKKEILQFIYLFRYYKLIYIDDKNQIKDINELEGDIEKTEKHLITKVCKLKIINILCQNISENYKLLSKIFSYNIIDLEDVKLEFKMHDKNIILTIYDDETIEDSIICDEKEELNVKFNKKIRLFN